MVLNSRDCATPASSERPAAMKLGCLLPTWTGAMDGITPRARDVVSLAQSAEAAGFDSVWLSDHLYFEPYTDFRVVGVEFPPEFAGVRLGAWDCWSLAAGTQCLEIGPGLEVAKSPRCRELLAPRRIFLAVTFCSPTPR